MACHLRVAAADALLGHPGASLGLITGWGGTARLPRLVGCACALELPVTGRAITADEARRHGLVNRVVSPEQFLPVANDLAREAGRVSAPPLRP